MRRCLTGYAGMYGEQARADIGGVNGDKLYGRQTDDVDGVGDDNGGTWRATTWRGGRQEDDDRGAGDMVTRADNRQTFEWLHRRRRTWARDVVSVLIIRWRVKCRGVCENHEPRLQRGVKHIDETW